MKAVSHFMDARVMGGSFDVMRLRVGTWKNGAVHRENVVANMAFPPHYLVAFHSSVMTLYPGDIISTGTPAGVGLGQKPEPVYLKPGDIVELGIDGLGSSKQVAVAYK